MFIWKKHMPQITHDMLTLFFTSFALSVENN